MTIKTKSVQGRRELSFSNLEDIVADAERLVSSTRTRTLGNWPLTQLLEAIHPAFGKMNHDEWTKLHLRHSEMHLSFAVPE